MRKLLPLLICGLVNQAHAQHAPVKTSPAYDNVHVEKRIKDRAPMLDTKDSSKPASRPRLQGTRDTLHWPKNTKKK